MTFLGQGSWKTTWVNRRCRRTGQVFQGRYKVLLVDTDSYLLELVRLYTSQSGQGERCRIAATYYGFESATCNCVKPATEFSTIL